MDKRTPRILRFVLRWTIAVVGILWVVANLHWRDRILFVDASGAAVEAPLVEPGDENGQTFTVQDPKTSQPLAVDRDHVLSTPDRKTVVEASTGQTVKLQGMQLTRDSAGQPIATRLYVHRAAGDGWLEPSNVVKGFSVTVPQPVIQPGMQSMVQGSNQRLLLASLAVIPITFVFTTIRWHKLLLALGISLSMTRAFVLNMVGAFYNSFMPGSTGGDVLKAYYAAKQAPTRRTAAVMSVIIDRAIGLLTLIILGGVMAAISYARSSNRHDAAANASLQVAIVAVSLMIASVLGLVVIYSPRLRYFLGYNFLVHRLPMQTQVRKVIEVVKIYREKPMLIFWAILMTFPVHLAVIISAMLAGMAFKLPISPAYYFIVVPVVVLAGAVPISPQGVGVMEAFAFYLTRAQGVSVNQVLALTMSIRLVQIAWNLVGGIFVLRGGYHSPTESEQAELAKDQGPGIEPLSASAAVSSTVSTPA